MGLRELKKEQTRKLIADTAWRLFEERGFDRVSAAQVAREAQVSEATLYNYFPTKEDLFYSRLETFEARLTEVISARDAGEPVLDAFQRHLTQQADTLAQREARGPGAFDALRRTIRMIEGSPALKAREQRTLAEHTSVLGDLLAVETEAADADISPYVAANALMGVHRALIDYVRRRVLAEDQPTGLADDVRGIAERAFALLADGLGDYARKPARNRADE